MVLGLSSCGGSDPDTTEPEVVNESIIKTKAPVFDEDIAYQNIKDQLDFGFRIPGTPAHKKCADFLFAELKKYCDTVYYQVGTTKNYRGETLPVYNIIGSFLPNHPQRGIFASHWDSRPFADNDQDPKNHDKPVPAANDGASGVGVIISMAHSLKTTKPAYGIDLILFDVEDYGKGEFQNSFCLGSQYWTANKHVPNYTANYGVLLDMVGAKDALFGRESFSEQNAGYIMSHTWNIAQELGYGNHFVNTASGPTIDDHYYVNKGTGIPMIDVIQFDPKGGFADYWHTIKDDITTIHKPTLKAVGTTMLHLVFNPPFTLAQ